MTNFAAAARLPNLRGSCLGPTCLAPIDLFVNHSTTTSFAIGAPPVEEDYGANQTKAATQKVA
jgi:hypothetical protein